MKLQNQVQMKKYSSLFLMFNFLFGFAQNYKGEIKNIKGEGLHQIQLSPEVRAAANENIDYFRIFDRNKKEVPYVIYDFNRKLKHYNVFKIVSKKSIKDSITSIIIQNETGNKINQFCLSIGNTTLTKNYSISGSNDTIAWFGLVANQTLSGLVSQQGTTLEKNVYFPANNYNYLRIDFNDKKTLPIDVQDIGIYENQLLPEELIALKTFRYYIIVDNEKKVTQIVFSADKKHQIDAISFDINTDLYARDAKLIVNKERKIRKRIEKYEEVISTFQLNSKNSSIFDIDHLNEKKFIIEIENKDNQPLAINDIQLFQKPIIIVSKLKANGNYEVVIDSAYSKPSYDLANFVQSFSLGIPKATITNFKKVEKKEIQLTEKPFWQTQLFMWFCIVLGGGIVAYFAFGLLKDMKKE